MIVFRKNTGILVAQIPNPQKTETGHGDHSAQNQQTRFE